MFSEIRHGYSRLCRNGAVLAARARSSPLHRRPGWRWLAVRRRAGRARAALDTARATECLLGAHDVTRREQIAQVVERGLRRVRGLRVEGDLRAIGGIEPLGVGADLDARVS